YPRRRRFILRLPELRASGFAGRSFAKRETPAGYSLSPGERARVRASQKQTSFTRSPSYLPVMADIQRARQLRKKETWAEKLVWRWLRDRRFSHYKFRRQHPIGDYHLDFFCEEAELNVELDGSQHG